MAKARRKYYFLYHPHYCRDQDENLLDQGESDLLREIDSKHILCRGHSAGAGVYADFMSFYDDPALNERVSVINSIKVYTDVYVWGKTGADEGYVKLWLVYAEGPGYLKDYAGISYGGAILKIYTTSPETGLPWTKVQAETAYLEHELHSADIFCLYHEEEDAFSYAGCDYAYVEIDYEPAIIMGVTNLPATNIGNLKGTLNGNIEDNGGECTERGFLYKEDENGAEDSISEKGDFPNGNYGLPVTGLKADTLYYFKAWAENKIERVYADDWESFTTTNLKPTISTQIATSIGNILAKGNGTIIDGGGLETCLQRGFEIEYEFSGNMEEYNAWVGHGFEGEIIYNPSTGKWEGTLTKIYLEEGNYSEGSFSLTLDDLTNNKTYLYRAEARNSVGWGYGSKLEFTTGTLLTRKACTCGVFTILLCAIVASIPESSVIKRRGFRWGIYNTSREYDIHEDGNFSASAIIGPIDTISFVCSNDDNVYDTIVDSAKGFKAADFKAGQLIYISATGAIDPANKGQFKIISVSEDGGTITVNVRNTLISEGPVTGVTIVELYALYIVDLDHETSYYSVAYVAIEDSLGNWTVQEGNITETKTITNPFDIEGYDKVEFYKPEREQNYKKITRRIEAEIIAEQQYIGKAGGRRVLDIPNHLIQSKENAVLIGTSYKERFKNIKSRMEIEYPTPAPFQREDTLDIGFGRIRFKKNDMGVVNFMPDGEGLMLFRYRMIMLIRKINMGYTVSKESIDYMATMELEEA